MESRVYSCTLLSLASPHSFVSTREKGSVVPEDFYYRIRPQVSVITHSPDEVELRHGVWNPISCTFADEQHSGQLARLIARLDGSASALRIAAEERVSREQIERLIDDLLNYGLVEKQPSTALDYYLMAATQWRAAEGLDPNQRVLILADEPLQRPIEDGLVAMLGDRVDLVSPDEPAIGVLDSPDTSWLNDGLATEEHLAMFEGWRGAVLVAASATINPVRTSVLNRACLHHGIRWVQAALDGPFVFVGPSILPGESACFECLEKRVFMNLREGANYQKYKSAIVAGQIRLGTSPMLAPLASLLSAHLVIEVLNFVLTGTTFTVGKMLVIHVPTMEVSFPDVLRMPGCSACGAVPERDGHALYFDPPLEPAVTE